MNISDELYEHQEFVNEFNERWFKIAKKEHITYLRECKKFFIDDGKTLPDEDATDEEREDTLSFRYELTPLSKLIEHLNLGDTRAESDLKRMLDVINEYRKVTLYKIKNENYSITLAELAIILDLEETYISRTILNRYFDHFRINYLARMAIKEYDDKDLDIRFLNKWNFVSYESVFKFLKEHLKFTEDRVRIQLELTMADRLLLKEKYKTYGALKKGINKVCQKISNATNEQMIQLLKLTAGNVAGREKYLHMLTKDGESIKKEYQQDFHIEDTEIENIISRKKILLSLDTMRNRARIDHNSSLLVSDSVASYDMEFGNFSLKSYNDNQIYSLMKRKSTYRRYILKDVFRSNNNIEKIKYVRYVTDLSILLKDLKEEAKKDNMSEEEKKELRRKNTIEHADIVFSITTPAFKHITEGSRNKEEEDEALRMFFVEELGKIAATINEKKDI